MSVCDIMKYNLLNSQTCDYPQVVQGTGVIVIDNSSLYLFIKVCPLESMGFLSFTR